MDVQEEHATQERQVNEVPKDTWYIQRKRDGLIEGRIVFNATAELEIKQSIQLQQNQDEYFKNYTWGISPRSISIRSETAPRNPTEGENNFPPIAFKHDVRGLPINIYYITSQEFGTSIFAKQEGLLIFCKWTSIYYNGGVARGRYCELTYFVEVKGDELIPNWKLFKLGNTDIETCGLKYLDCFRHHYRESSEKLYRISQVSIPTLEEAPDTVNRIILTDEIRL